MKHETRKTKALRFAVLLLAGVLLVAGPALAKTTYLVAKEFTKSLPAKAQATPIDFNNGTIDPYGGLQDFPGGTTVLDGGATLEITGNHWKKRDLIEYGGYYTVTPETVLEFDFRCPIEGEIHAIGLDTSASMLHPQRAFQLYGTQTWGIQDFNDYPTGADANGWRHYVIPIGQYYTGTFSMVFFANDDDANFAADEFFRNVSVHEPGKRDVLMWGFGEDVDADNDGVGDCYASGDPASAACAAVTPTVPGPRIKLFPNDAFLRIRLINLLPEPTSIVIPGQELPDFPAGTYPVWTDGTSGARNGDLTKRVRSFTREAAPNGGKRDYRWSAGTGNPFQAGSYIYESGTHPAVQVQMGLYGPVTKDTAPSKVAYTNLAGDVKYNQEVLLFYSEIDADLHDAIQNGDYGPAGTVKSTIGYQPEYFLVNGEPYDPNNPDSQQIYGLKRNRETLFRVFNASLETHVPTFQDGYLRLVAEDGNAYPYVREQYSMTAAPGKTMDGLFKATRSGTHVLYDARRALTSDTNIQGGMLTFLNFITPGVIDFHQYDLLSYGVNQDLLNGQTVEILDGGETLHLVGNAWKRIDLGYSVTANTVLEFDFKSTVEGEIHGIGLDADNDIGAGEQTFELFGTQIWGIQDFHDYTTADGWKHYTIPVGTYFTGTGMYMTFSNDHDVPIPTAESFFRRVKIYEQ